MVTSLFRGTALVPALALVLGIVSVFSAQWAAWLGIALILLAGIPHGAFDLKAARLAWGGEGRSTAAIVGAYCAVGGMMSAVCLMVPTVGLIFFLAISVIHFSEGERGTLGYFGGVIVGLAAIVAPIGWHVEVAARYTAFFVDGAAMVAFAPVARLSADILGLAVVVLGLYLAARRCWRDVFELGICLVSWALFDPLAGFAVWFIGRHGRHHLARCRQLFVTGPQLFSADTVLISIVAIVLIAPLALKFDLRVLEELFAASIVLVAGLTLPHMVVTHRSERFMGASHVRPDERDMG
jgi:Brp/Blh family beta-carotene 15,15'-monooxygenase